MFARLILIAGFALTACGPADGPEPSAGVVEDFTNRLDRKAADKDAAVTAAADARAEARADAAARRISGSERTPAGGKD